MAQRTTAIERIVFTGFLLAVLGALPYVRALWLPFISDDYIQLSLGRRYGPVSGWAALFSDALYRCRFTSLVLTHWTEQWFGLTPAAFNASSLLIHIWNTWLLAALGAWRFIGWRLSVAAAAFFAVAEMHQEAVIWYAALPELLVFFFLLLAFMAWIFWLRTQARRWYAASLLCFLLALASKESAVVIAPLLAAATLIEGRGWRRAAASTAPFWLLGLAYALGIYQARSEHLFFHDGTFSLNAPFLKTLMVSSGRLFWFWGAAALALLVARPAVRQWRTLSFAGAWIALTLLPYCFLTYMPRVPSRHTYLASAGVALVVAAAFLELRERFSRTRPWVVTAVVALMIAHNCGYVWTRKHMQYVERAAPTEKLIRFARKHVGPIRLHCFPYSMEVAQLALEVTGVRQAPALAGGAPDSEPGALFCLGHNRGPADDAAE